jgi:dehydrogenase/reductase SDR family member 12
MPIENKPAPVPAVPLKKLITFYARFTPSYSAIGYWARRIFWRRRTGDFRGQTWLVVGGSEGIGGAAARAAVEGGATVICVGRNAAKLEAFAQSCVHPGKVEMQVADCSLQRDVWSLLERLGARGGKLDVVINNVGIQKRDQILTAEGLETSFATNILSHYLITRELLARGLLSAQATVIEVSSGGMYNHPLVVADLNITGAGYLGVRAYGLSKRAQVAMTQYWRGKFTGSGMRFYVMHPGWVNTAAIGRSMPRFKAILGPILRTDPQGADTIVWLAGRRPAQKSDASIWFDRRERPPHIYPRTRQGNDTPQALVDSLDAYVQRHRPGAVQAAPGRATEDTAPATRA